MRIFVLIVVTTLINNSCLKFPISEHSDGKKFFNPETGHTFKDQIKWMWQMKTVEWPKCIEDIPQPAPPSTINGNKIRVTYINQATVLIQTNGINILTDPIFSRKAGPVSWLGTERIRKPGVAFDSLPQIDYILISHNHYDHLDIPSLKILARKHNSTVLTGLGNKKQLQSIGFKNVIELDWWDNQKQKDSLISFTFVPARHSSGRGLFDKDKTLWGGFVIITTNGDIYFAGDTGFGEFSDQIQSKFKDFVLAILPIGSYEKRWFMKDQHMNPDDAVDLHLKLNVAQSIGMHYATFAEHPEQVIDAHEKDLKTALERYNVDPLKFRILKFGEGFEIKK
jgi:L-ascorbate metabolism protein UlaG (beta-lactamase superfamily)